MARRPGWWHTLQASKSEALLAVDLYNRSGNERQLEAFIVHMSLAWLRLLQAKVDRDGGELYVRDPRNRRMRTRDGDWRYRPSSELAGEVFCPRDPRAANLEFFTGIRNRIEHRYERDIASLVAGRTQAYVLNYEQSLVEWFGEKESVGNQLRFPIFLSSITEDAVTALKSLRARIPRGVLDWVHEFDSKIAPEIAADQAYEFRVFLVPQVGPKTQADAALTYVKMEDLDEDQRNAVKQVQQIIREKQVLVSNLGALMPMDVTKRVRRVLPWKFSINDHTRAWKFYNVRPLPGADNPRATRGEFCRYDEAFRQYVYTEAWVKYLIKELSKPESYARVLGRAPGEDTRAH